MALCYFYFIASCIKRFQLLLGEVNDCADWRVSDCSEGILYAEGAHQHVFVCVNVMLARYMILSPTTTRKRTTKVRKEIRKYSLCKKEDVLMER